MTTKWVKPTKFNALLKKHKPATADENEGSSSVKDSDPLRQLVYAWLLWESSTSQAEAAMEKILEARVDFNELRVSLPHELAAIVGKRYPYHEERFTRMKQSLQSVYLNHHAMTLEHLSDLSKKQAKTYLDRLSGMHPFVSSHVLSVALGGHSIPADEQLVLVLIERGVITEQVEVGTLISWMTTQVRAAEAVWVIPALQAICDEAWEDGTVTKINRRRRAEREALEAEKERKKAAQIAAEKAAEKAAIKAAEKAAQKAREKSSKKVVAKKTAPKASKTTAKKTAKKTAKTTAKKTAKTTAKKTTKKVTKKAAKKVAKKAAKKVVKKAAKKTAKKTPARTTLKKKASKSKKTVKKPAARKKMTKKKASRTRKS